MSNLYCSYTMAITGYILSVIPWQEQVTFCQLYHGKNRLHFVSYTMARSGYILSAIPWQEQVTFCQLYYGKNRLHFVSYTMARTGYISMRWCQLYHGKNRLHFNEMMSAIPWQEQVTFLWDDVYFVLYQQCVINMLLHYDTLTWFQANQSRLFLLNAVCFIAEKQQISIS